MEQVVLERESFGTNELSRFLPEGGDEGGIREVHAA
jgi:hypothetical protein